MCCYISKQTITALTSSLQFATTGRLTLKDPSSTQIESICQFFCLNNVKAKPVAHLIILRTGRLSSLLSAALRHEGEGRHVRLSTRTPQTWGAVDGVFLMTMFPKHGKSRFVIACVYPTYDGSYDERARNNNIAPKHRWIDSLNSGSNFFNCASDAVAEHTRRVDLDAMGRALQSISNGKNLPATSASQEPGQIPIQEGPGRAKEEASLRFIILQHAHRPLAVLFFLDFDAPEPNVAVCIKACVSFTCSIRMWGHSLPAATVLEMSKSWPLWLHCDVVSTSC